MASAAVGAAGLLAGRPLEEKLVPKAELADGYALIIGALKTSEAIRETLQCCPPVCRRTIALKLVTIRLFFDKKIRSVVLSRDRAEKKHSIGLMGQWLFFVKRPNRQVFSSAINPI